MADLRLPGFAPTALVPLLGLLPACGAGPGLERVAPLEIVERFPVEYSGNLGSGARSAWEAPAGQLLPRSEPPASIETAAAGERVRGYEVNTRMLAMSPEAATRFLGFDALPELSGATPAGGRVAWDSLDERVDALIESGFAEEIASPSLVVSDGIPGRFDAESHHSYLQGFDLAVDGARFMADPRVDEIRSGLRMRMQIASRTEGASDGGVECQLELRTLSLVGGLHEFSSRLPGGGRLALQVPVFLQQELRADAVLPRREVLVITGIQLPESAEVLVVFVDPFGRRRLDQLDDGGLPRGRSGVSR